MHQRVQIRLLVILATFALSEVSWSQTGRMVALGSSTTAGYGVPTDSGWVARFNNYYKNQLQVIDFTYNLGVAGNTMYSAMPTSYVNRLRPIQPDPNVNVTRANKLLRSLPTPGKGVVIVNFPSNGYDYMSISEVLTALQLIYDSARRTGNKCFVTTTQPRTSGAFGTPAIKRKMVQLKDAIIAQFGVANTLNFFDGMYNPADTSILTAFALGDGTHFNSAGHRELFRRIAAKNVFDLPGPAEGDFKSAVTSGNWNSPSSWRVWNGLNWISSTTYPSAKNVTISSGNSITLTTPVSINNLVISSNSTLTTNQFTLDLKGNLILNGTLATQGSVLFSGTAIQNISGTTVCTFKDLTINNSSGVFIESNQNIKGIITLGTGALLDADGATNNNTLTLLSSADNPTQDASVALLPTGARVQGKVTVQRFMSQEGTNNRIYRNISAPVQGATVADLQNEIPVTGTFTGASSCAGCNTNPSLFWYNEQVKPHINLQSGYVAFPKANNNELFVSGRGYSVYVRGNLLPTALWDMRGTVVQANVTPFSFPVTYTNTGNANNDGWNLVGNPFPSAIDWNATGWVKTNVDATIYFKDNGANPPRYASWNGTVGVNGGSQVIPIGQAFWVKTNGSPSLTASETVKTTAPTTFFRQESTQNLLRVSVAKGNLKDEIAIHFREGATIDFDQQADAWKLPSDKISISSINPNNDKLSINSLPLLKCDVEIPLNMELSEQGDYEIQIKGAESFDSDVSVALVDEVGNTNTLVKEDFTYTFQVSENTVPSKRFLLRFKKEAEPLKIESENGKLTVFANGSVQWYLNGSRIEGATFNTFQPDLSGTYLAIVTKDGCQFSGYIEYIVTETQSIHDKGFQVYPNPFNEVLTFQKSSGALEFTMFDLLGREVFFQNFPGSSSTDTVPVRHLPVGVYILKVTSNGQITILKLSKR